MTLQLYCFGESGHSYKAALSLALMGLDWEPVAIDFFNGETRHGIPIGRMSTKWVRHLFWWMAPPD